MTNSTVHKLCSPINVFGMNGFGRIKRVLSPRCKINVRLINRGRQRSDGWPPVDRLVDQPDHLSIRREHTLHIRVPIRTKNNVMPNELFVIKAPCRKYIVMSSRTCTVYSYTCSFIYQSHDC